MKMWSICDSSASVRSPTPVPASMRMSLSRRKEVVRRCLPPIPPEHPRTRSFIGPALLFVEHRHAVPARRGRVATVLGDFLWIDAGIQFALGVHALQVQQVHFDMVPLLR